MDIKEAPRRPLYTNVNDWFSAWDKMMLVPQGFILEPLQFDTSIKCR